MVGKATVTMVQCFECIVFEFLSFFSLWFELDLEEETVKPNILVFFWGGFLFWVEFDSTIKLGLFE